MKAMCYAPSFIIVHSSLRSVGVLSGLTYL